MNHPKEERTVLLIKPDGVMRGLTGEILSRVEQRGLKFIALKMIKATREQIDSHYPKDEKWISRLGEKTLKTYNEYKVDPKKELGTDDPYKIGQEVRKWLVDFMVSGPIVKAVVEGVHAVKMVRKLAGNTLPSLAEMGTIRGDFSVDSPTAANRDKRAIRNIVHASETPEEASHEMSHWFAPEDIHTYSRSVDKFAF